jgi:hypothetical protein
VPLARWSLRDLRQAVVSQGLVAQISRATLWRWLSQDALRRWRHRDWIFPRDPAFAPKAERILELYAGRWDGAPLGPREYVLVGRREDQRPGPAPDSPPRSPPPRGGRCTATANTFTGFLILKTVALLEARDDFGARDGRSEDGLDWRDERGTERRRAGRQHADIGASLFRTLTGV